MGKKIPFPTYRLNYPPEEAQTLIRDQTRSTFLEEIVHPFRESFYVNGYMPSKENEIIMVSGKKFLQKTIIRYVPSNIVIRFLFGAISLTLFYFLFCEWKGLVYKKRYD